MFTPHQPITLHSLANRPSRRYRIALAALSALPLLASSALAWDVSPAPILQYFESTYKTLERRMPDAFNIGYGMIYTPPPGRADQGNFSVGYDQFDRFDLGSAGNPTLYGTETGLKQTVAITHRAGIDFGVDLVLNHNGYSGTGDATSRGAFAQAGGYPGMALYLQNTDPNAPMYNTRGYSDADGDFNSAFDYSTVNERLAGLIDINHGKNYQFIRSPVDPNDPRNIPAGTVAQFGRIANVPDPNNRRFYPDTTGAAGVIYVYDPKTGEQNIPIYNFNQSNPMAGTPTPENVTGYLMRNTQWMVQDIGIDAFRIDAAKHIEGFALDYYDRSVYRQSTRYLLNGQQKQIFSWCETYDGNQGYLQTFVQKTIDPNNPGKIGANRDTLDFPLFFAMRDNLTGNGYQNSWYNIRNAGLDMHDDGLHNGSQGVTFVSSHDNGGAYLSNVAYAYTLMMPGNTIVYDNASEFGTARNTFPQPGRGDALGGVYGGSIAKLVDLRNRYGQGDFRERWVEAKNYAFERSGSSITLLNSEPALGGYDSRTILTDFAPGTRLIELTGNAGDPNSDPFGDIPKMVVVNNDHTVNVRFLHNVAPGTSRFTGNGYLVYGLASPQGSVSFSGISQTLAGSIPTLQSTTSTDPNVQRAVADANAYANATTRVNDVKVVTGNSFSVTLNSTAVNLLGNPAFREQAADGDNALVKLDEGVDLNGNGHVDYVTPGNAAYGFEEFTGTHSPGFFNADGNGTYAQSIDTSHLSEGMHFLTVRAFRHRSEGGPAIYTDWKQSIYVDRLPPSTGFVSFNPDHAGVNENRQLRVQSLDMTADNVHVFLDLGAALTDAQVLAMVGSGSQGDVLDRNIFQKYLAGVTNGNHAATVVTYEIDGNYSVKRFNASQNPALSVSTIIGAGIGDLNFDGSFNSTDINQLSSLVQSNNAQFNPAADVDGAGVIDLHDVFLMGPILTSHNVDNATWNAFNTLIYSSTVTTGTYIVNSNQVIYEDTAGTTNVTAGKQLTATFVRGALNIATGAKTTIRLNPTNSGTSVLTSLTIAPQGSLDLNGNALILHSTTANQSADLQTVAALVATGYDAGKWDGLGIVSSPAAADNSGRLALGVISNNFGGAASTIPLYNSFRGQPAVATDVLIRQTYYGDANLDGVVNGTDYTRIDAGYGSQGTATPLSGWYNGDFNYDGHIDGSDYSLIDGSYGAAMTPLAGPSSMVATTSAELAPTGPVSVPEPAGLSFAMLAVSLLARRRKDGSSAHGRITSTIQSFSGKEVTHA